MAPLLYAVVLWIHFLSTGLLVGGSLFVWLVGLSAPKLIAKDESEGRKL